VKTSSHILAGGILSFGLIGVALQLTTLSWWELFLGVLALLLGSTAPDASEYNVLASTKDGHKPRWVAHRTYTHYWLFWLLAALLSYQLWMSESSLVWMLLFAFSVGGLLHIAQDLLTPMGVPLLLPRSKRISVPFVTGELSEGVFLITLSWLSYFSGWYLI
jgi:membrane-bound metal-dependent hydrolase YbcI (DUF457 family)